MHTLLFSDLKGVVNCVDDFLISGQTREEHDSNLANFFNRCKQVGLKLKRSKLQHCRSAVRFLGHVVGRDGIAIPASRTAAIQTISPPKDPKEVRQFLGVLNYVSKFIPNYSQRTASIRSLTRSEADFI